MKKAKEEEAHMAKLLLGMPLLLTLLNTAALADFYIVRDTIAKGCAVVENNPANGVDGVAYKTKADAEKAMKANKACGIADD